MQNTQYRRFYLLSLAVLTLLCLYPLVNGGRMAALSIAQGAIQPEQYAKYVVPYAAMAVAVLVFAALQPPLLRLRRLALPLGLALAGGVFVAAEQFFERMQIRTTGMALVDTATLTVDQTQNLPWATADAWQASLCITSPLTRGQTVAYASVDRSLYVLANSTYKIHYYLIALMLIAMVCALVYALGRRVHSGDQSNAQPLRLRGMATAALLALCVFANTTAFFRQTAAIQTPLASVLTCLFFVGLGTAVGVYVGSYLLTRSKGASIGLPVGLGMAAVALMYVAEAAMMSGGLYRFGEGWFYQGLGGIAVAPVDLLVILLSGAATALVLHGAHRRRHWPGKIATAAVLALCTLIAAGGVGVSVSAPKAAVMVTGDSVAASASTDDITGCYAFDTCLFMNPLSSFSARKESMPVVYGLDADTLIIADSRTGNIDCYPAQYVKTPVAEGELAPEEGLSMESFPDLSRYRQRWLRAVFNDSTGRQMGLYQMDGEIWLATVSNGRLWSIYRLQRTDKTTLSDLKRALTIHESPEGGQQMTLQDVYDLARKGQALSAEDLKPFDGKAVGSGFWIVRYDIQGGCVLLVHSDAPDSPLNYTRLSKQGYDPFNSEGTVDIREGPQALSAYLDPLHSLVDIKIEDPKIGPEGQELLYEAYGYRYSLRSIRANKIFVTFASGERMPIKQALEERRLTVEDAVAKGLSGVVMEPTDGPISGYFPLLHHALTFDFDGMDFTPSSSFLFVAYEQVATYFDLAELADTLEYQDKQELANRLRQLPGTAQLADIAGKRYIDGAGLAQAGITVDIGWALSSHTPVQFRSAGQ